LLNQNRKNFATKDRKGEKTGYNNYNGTPYNIFFQKATLFFDDEKVRLKNGASGSRCGLR